MKIDVLLFASLPEIAGERRLEVELEEGATLGDLRAHLVERWPAVRHVPFVFARNRDYARDDVELRSGDEVACVPAISGGEDIPRVSFTFQDDMLDPNEIEGLVRTDADGAIVTFHGVTRNHHEGQAVSRLSYEAYEEMAVQKGRAILEELASKHDIGRLHVVHRLGEVPIGEASILVVVASAHRGPSFDAAREAMDRIKHELPIFKKEYLEDAPSDASSRTRWVGDLPDLD